MLRDCQMQWGATYVRQRPGPTFMSALHSLCRDICNEFVEGDSDLICVWEAKEWMAELGDRDAQRAAHGIDETTITDQLRVTAKCIQRQARAWGKAMDYGDAVIHGLIPYLEGLADEARALSSSPSQGTDS